MAPVPSRGGLEHRAEIQKYLKENKHVQEYKETMKKTPMSLEMMRRNNWDMSQEVMQAKLFDSKDVQDDWCKLYRALEEIGLVEPGSDISFCVSVIFNLFVGCVLRLGTEKHQEILEKVDNGMLMGAFALTEIKHGVMSGAQMETTAEYDPSTQLFIINSNCHGGGKDWITNLSAEFTQYAILFALLKVKGNDEGVHAFLVELQNEDGTLKSGIKIVDNGDKAAFKGVWTSRVWFEGFSVPRHALLNRYSNVSEDGTFTTSLGKPHTRFFSAADMLMSGRLIIASLLNTIARNALYLIVTSIANRTHERVKRDKSIERSVLIDKITAKQPFLSHICEQIGLSISLMKRRKHYARLMKSKVENPPPKLANDICGLKYYAAASANQVVNMSVDVSGGPGALSENILVANRQHLHTLALVEGDKMIMMQKCAGTVIKSNSSSMIKIIFVILQAHILLWVSYLWTWFDPFCYTRLSYLKHLLWARETVILSRLLRKVISKQTAHIWNTQCLSLAEELCEVYVQQMIFSDLEEEKRGCPSKVRESVISPMLTVFALTTLTRDRGNLWIKRSQVFDTLERICANTDKSTCCALVESFVHSASPIREAPMVANLQPVLSG